MPVYKRKYRSGKVAWYYQFALPGSTRQNQNLVTESGFATKQEATDAEAVRRAEELVREAATGGVAAPMPTTLAMLLAEFMKQHAEENLAPKTVERYREMAAYIAPELLAMNMTEITPLHLSREWTRLLKCGGHTRKSKTSRPMKPKTVRNIAGLVSSAFVRAIKWGLATTNPVTHSDLPKVRKRIGMALLPSEQDRLTQCATGPWCLSVFLDVAAATGARRGEVLALRWSDVNGMIALIDRSLCQTRDGLVFKSTKTEEPRKVELPPSMVASLEAHRLRQDEFRRQFGPDYRSDLDLIFANPDGSPLMPNSISSTVSRLCRRLGLPKGASLHVLRHSHASLLLADGVDLATVSARLGHSSVRTTADIYSHAIRGKDHAASQSWDDIMQRSRAEAEKSKTVN
ncbi:MAG TPA: tyrosine-type recombinase/integrase [Bryobacteraceae bacterium]|jgi:integrase